MRKYNIEYQHKGIAERTLYAFEEKNKKGETIKFEISKCVADLKSKHSVMLIWKKAGYIKEVLTDYWYIKVYATDKDGNCFEKYNPLVKISDDGKLQVTNFDFLLSATEENKQRLIEEIERRAYA